MKKEWFWRGSIFLTGMFIAAAGITLNTVTGLGTSCVTAFYYALSLVTPLSFAQAAFLIYMIAVALEFLCKGKNREWTDLLQIPFALFYSFLLGAMEKALQSVHPAQLWQNLLLLALAVVCIGIGTSMMLNMHVVVAPPDGLVSALAMALHRSNGFCKNLIDGCCVAGACAVDLLCSGKLVSVGLGTVVSMIFIGRVIAVWDHFFKRKMRRLAGVER